MQSPLGDWKLKAKAAIRGNCHALIPKFPKEWHFPRNCPLLSNKHCPNVSITPIMAMGCRQCLPFRDKHCQHPIAVMGVIDTFKQYIVDVLWCQPIKLKAFLLLCFSHPMTKISIWKCGYFCHLMWKTFCHFYRANSIKTNLLTCNLWTKWAVSYKSAIQIWK